MAAPDTPRSMLSRLRSPRSSLLGVGLFVALLLRERRYIGGAVLLLIGAALVAKGAGGDGHAEAGGLGDVAEAGRVHRDRRPVSLVLLLAVFLPRPVQIATCAIALLSSLLLPLLGRRPAAAARAAHAVQLALRPPAQFQRPDAIGAARVAAGARGVAVRAPRAGVGRPNGAASAIG